MVDSCFFAQCAIVQASVICIECALIIDKMQTTETSHPSMCDVLLYYKYTNDNAIVEIVHGIELLDASDIYIYIYI